MLRYAENVFKYLHTVSALVLNVVDSKYILDTPELFVISIENAIIYGDKGALPVI